MVLFDKIKLITYIICVRPNKMISLLKKDWTTNPKYKKWSNISITTKSKKCECSNDDHHVELWEQDSCVRGRIDTIICEKCDAIESFRIIR
jgi:hypothetical protein